MSLEPDSAFANVIKFFVYKNEKFNGDDINEDIFLSSAELPPIQMRGEQRFSDRNPGESELAGGYRLRQVPCVLSGEK